MGLVCASPECMSVPTIGEANVNVNYVVEGAVYDLENADEGRSIPTFDSSTEILDQLPPKPETPEFQENTSVEQTAIELGNTASNCAEIRVEYTIKYVNEKGKSVGLPDAQVRIWDEEKGEDDLLAKGITNNAGFYRSPTIKNVDDGSNQGKLDVYVEVALANSAIMVKTRFAAVPYRGYSETFQEANPTTTKCVLKFTPQRLTGENHENATRFFAEGMTSWRHADSFATNTPPLVRVYWPDPSPGSHYEVGTKVISLRKQEVTQPHLMYHEYGHFVHHWAYGFEHHPFFYWSHTACEDNLREDQAFSEGFADFFAAYVRSRSGLGNTIDSRSIESQPCGSTSVKGPHVQWNVARLFWDLYDAGDEGTGAVYDHYGTGKFNPSTNSIWKVLTAGTDPDSMGEFRAAWKNLGNSPTMIDDLSIFNRIPLDDY